MYETKEQAQLYPVELDEVKTDQPMGGLEQELFKSPVRILTLEETINYPVNAAICGTACGIACGKSSGRAYAAGAAAHLVTLGH